MIHIIEPRSQINKKGPKSEVTKRVPTNVRPADDPGVTRT